MSPRKTPGCREGRSGPFKIIEPGNLFESTLAGFYWSVMIPAFNLHVWLGFLWSTFPLVGSAQTLADRLGYPAGTRMIIIQADDLGEIHAVDAAAIKALQSGTITLRARWCPAPGFPEISTDYAKSHPDADLVCTLP